MKHFLAVALLFILPSLHTLLPAQEKTASAQIISELEARKLVIEQQIQILQDSIYSIDAQINAQQSIDLITPQYALINAALDSGVQMVTSRAITLRSASDATSAVVTTVPGGRSIQIIAMEKYPFYKVKYKDQIGYVESSMLDQVALNSCGAAKTEAYLAYLIKTSTGYQAKESTPSSSSYDYTPSTNSSSKTIYTGPRGGRYHYSASGKKVYEKKH